MAECPCPHHPTDCYGHTHTPQECGCNPFRFKKLSIPDPPRAHEEPLPNPRNYAPLSVNCNISATSLADAARILGPAFIYSLCVNPYLLIDTRSVLRRMQPTEFSDNPLYPHINLHPDETLGKYEWYLVANGKGCGSKGV